MRKLKVTSDEKNGNGVNKTVPAQVSIREWWAVTMSIGEESGELILVRIDGPRYGLLEVKLPRAFDGSDDWCELNLVAKGGVADQDSGSTRFMAPQIELPQSLRKHIACRALANEASFLAQSIDEDLIEEVPSYGTYLAAQCLSDGEFKSGALEEFADCISDRDAVGCTEEDDIKNMKRLVRECKKFIPAGQREKVPLDTHGYDR